MESNLKTVLHTATRAELIARISNLTSTSSAQWGKMTPAQMVEHCTRADANYQGIVEYPRSLAGRLFGRLALRMALKDEKPLGKHAPTHPAFIVTSSDIVLETAKHTWIEQLHHYAQLPAGTIHHWFFGAMTREQAGMFAYKHADHHLRQFGC